MGMELTVTLGSGLMPHWPAVRGVLEEAGTAVQMRMIDGQLALPEEEPPEAWRELRLGTPAGMVTVRREAGRVVIVVWGNADAALRQAADAVARAFAEAGGGTVGG